MLFDPHPAKGTFVLFNSNPTLGPILGLILHAFCPQKRQGNVYFLSTLERASLAQGPRNRESAPKIPAAGSAKAPRPQPRARIRPPGNTGNPGRKAPQREGEGGAGVAPAQRVAHVVCGHSGRLPATRGTVVASTASKKWGAFNRDTREPRGSVLGPRLRTHTSHCAPFRGLGRL